MNHDAGVYGAGYRVFQFALLPAASIESAVFHRFLRRGRDDPSGQLRQAVRMSSVLAALNGMLAALLIIVSSSLHLFLGHGFQESRDRYSLACASRDPDGGSSKAPATRLPAWIVCAFAPSSSLRRRLSP